jgi:hypothetical protein
VSFVLYVWVTLHCKVIFRVLEMFVLANNYVEVFFFHVLRVFTLTNN